MRSTICALLIKPYGAHLVGEPAVATHHLKAFIWNVLRDDDEYLAQ